MHNTQKCRLPILVYIRMLASGYRQVLLQIQAGLVLPKKIV